MKLVSWYRPAPQAAWIREKDAREFELIALRWSMGDLQVVVEYVSDECQRGSCNMGTTEGWQRVILPPSIHPDSIEYQDVGEMLIATDSLPRVKPRPGGAPSTPEPEADGPAS